MFLKNPYWFSKCLKNLADYAKLWCHKLALKDKIGFTEHNYSTKY